MSVRKPYCHLQLSISRPHDLQQIINPTHTAWRYKHLCNRQVISGSWASIMGYFRSPPPSRKKARSVWSPTSRCDSYWSTGENDNLIPNRNLPFPMTTIAHPIILLRFLSTDSVSKEKTRKHLKIDPVEYQFKNRQMETQAKEWIHLWEMFIRSIYLMYWCNFRKNA